MYEPENVNTLDDDGVLVNCPISFVVCPEPVIDA
jgi:hypothetical protein